MPRVDRQTGFHRSTSDRDTSPAPIRFPPDNFKHSLTLFSKSFSSFPRGTCSLSVSRPYLALDGIYRPIGAAFPNNPTRRQRLVVRQGPGETGLSPSPAPLSRGLGPRSVAEDASPDYNSSAEGARFSSWAFPGSLAVTRGILRVVPLPPDWGCIPKQPDSPTAPRGATGSGHNGAVTLYCAPFQGTWARSATEDASPDYNSNTEGDRFS
ncbi:hypothetical protein DEO72_LG4g48 [Vigna unguiculata]|uniref:Protein TAR1 n=1 Tax=Vigna unguiculata TaxID=3917 RepID=A0A4D6LKR4_VIGUN|nr:hypothetical protein DEO72_LG4g48 [Vigna unguiculata]